MSGAARIGCGIVLGLFLGWQLVMAALSLADEVRAVPAGERKRALVAPESERIDQSLAWIELYRTIEKRVPEEAIVGFCFPLTHATFGAFYQVVPLVYPRRAVPITQDLPAHVVEGSADAARKLSRPSYIVDLKSGFRIPTGVSRVADGRDFTLWKIVK